VRRSIARLGHPVLRSKAQAVSVQEIHSKRFQSFIDELIDTMRANQGVGIAAPQVNVSKQVFCVECIANRRYRVRSRIPLYVIVNPKLEVLDSRVVGFWEGCLSVPGLKGWTFRYRKVRIQGWDRKGQRLCITASGFHARIIQHELDHLRGRVYLDRMKNMKSLSYPEHLKA